jgi:hypothetical protein
MQELGDYPVNLNVYLGLILASYSCSVTPWMQNIADNTSKVLTARV